MAPKCEFGTLSTSTGVNAIRVTKMFVTDESGLVLTWHRFSCQRRTFSNDLRSSTANMSKAPWASRSNVGVTAQNRSVPAVSLNQRLLYFRLLLVLVQIKRIYIRVKQLDQNNLKYEIGLIIVFKMTKCLDRVFTYQMFKRMWHLFNTMSLAKQSITATIHRRCVTLLLTCVPATATFWAF